MATVQTIIDGLPDAFQSDAAAGVDAVFQFDISGEQAAVYHLIVKDGALTINQGPHADPNVTLKADTPDFIALMTGEIDGMSAFMSGKLQVEGDLMLAQTFATLFRT